MIFEKNEKGHWVNIKTGIALGIKERDVNLGLPHFLKSVLRHVDVSMKPLLGRAAELEDLAQYVPYCSTCMEKQTWTTSGMVCKNGHGGAPASYKAKVKVDLADIIADDLTAEVNKSRNDAGEKAEFKKVATEFFSWWWNVGGTNTQDGFDDWWENHRNNLEKKDV